MGSFGERLRREREKRNIRLEQIAEATKIGTRSLKALEDENFSQLPGGIFNKGFVRAYARFLGIDEEEAVADYVAAAGDQAPSPDLVMQQRVMQKASRLAAEQASQSRGDFPATKLVITVLVIAAIVYGGIRLYRGGILSALRRPSLHRQMSQPQAVAPTPTPMVQPSPTPAVAETSPTPIASPSPTPQAQVAVPVPVLPTGGFVLSIKSSEECWVSIQTDGVPELTGTLAPNEQKTFTARTKIDLVIGHPSTTELSLNGKPLLIPGDLTRSRRIVVGVGGIQTP